MYYVERGASEIFVSVTLLPVPLEEVQVVCFTTLISFVPYWLENDGLIGQVYRRRK